jgi:hypothetical protein
MDALWDSHELRTIPNRVSEDCKHDSYQRHCLVEECVSNSFESREESAVSKYKGRTLTPEQ